MFISLLKRRPMRESGFTMIELLVAVVIIAILAAIAIPVYLNLKNEAVKSALKSDVNATVKAASIALTQGADISTITANGGAAYVPKNPAKGEVITITQATAPVTGAAFIQDRDNSNDGYVIKSATYSGAANGVADAKTVISVADDQYFTVNGSLSKAAGASVDYSYNFSSVDGKYTQSGTGGSSPSASASPSPSASASPSTPANQAPAFTSSATATAGTAGNSYAGYALTASGSPAPTFTSTDLTSKTGLVLSTSGVITGTISNSASGNVTVTIVASNGIGSPASQVLTIPVQSAPVITTSSATLPSGQIGAVYTGITLTASGTPTPSFSAPSAAAGTLTGLPIGLTLSSDGIISGTPTTSASVGTYSILVTVSNGVSPNGTKTFNLAVGPSSTLANYTFETNNEGFDGLSTRSTLQAKSGTGSLLMSKTTTGLRQSNGPILLASVPTATTYTISGAVYSSVTTPTVGVAVGFTWVSGGSTATCYTDKPDLSTVGWKSVTKSCLVPAGSTNLRLFVLDGDKAGSYYFDDMVLKSN